MVKESVKAIALKYLLNMKQNQSKMNSLEYTELKTQSYLQSDKMNNRALSISLNLSIL